MRPWREPGCVRRVVGGPRLPVATPEQIRAFARGLITGELLLADLEQEEWKISLMLIVGTMRPYENVGLIFVPMGPHHHLPWLNGIAPGFTTSIRLLPVENMAEFARVYEEMYAAVMA